MSSEWSTRTDVQGNTFLNRPTRPKSVTEYGNGQVYRKTYTAYDPTDTFHGNYDYVEVYDANGVAVSRADTVFYHNLLQSEHRMVTPGAPDPQSNANEFTEIAVDATSRGYGYGRGPLGIGGSSELTIAKFFVAGTLARKSQGSMVTVIRDIDLNSGLPLESRTAMQDEIGALGTRYAWDDLGRLTTVTPPPPELATTVEYPSVHQTVVTHGNEQHVYYYDNLGRVVEKRQPAYSEDPPAVWPGAPIPTTTTAVQYTKYDVAGRVTAESVSAQEGTPLTDIKWTTYDYEYNPISGPPSEPRIDPLGRLSRVTGPDMSVVETSYDGSATRTTVYGVQASGTLLNPETTYVSDAFGRLVSVDSPGDGADAEYSYDVRGNLLDVVLTDPTPETGESAEQTRSFGYGSLGHLRTATNPESGTVEYLEYAGDGRLLRWRDARGQHFENNYDTAGRLVTRSLVVNGSPVVVVENTYDYFDDGQVSSDAEGHLVRQRSYAVDAGQPRLVSTRVFGYHEFALQPASSCSSQTGLAGLNERLSWTEVTIDGWDQGLRTNYCYDVSGHLSGLEYPDYSGSAATERTEVGYEYHGSFLARVADAGRGHTYLDYIGRDAQSLPRRMYRSENVRTEIDRDDLGRPTNFAVTGFVAVPPPPPPPGEPQVGDPEPTYEYGTLWQTGQYEYDLAGNIKGIGLSTFHYDELSRLQGGAIEHDSWMYDLDYEYDSFGNMTYMNRWAGDYQWFEVDRHTNQLAQDVSHAVTYGYDENGNMTSAGAVQYIYDPQNRMTEVWDTQTQLVGRYDYDAAGYRVRSVTDDVETFYFRDGQGRVLSEFSRAPGESSTPRWNKDYIYAMGQAITLLKNDDPPSPSQLRVAGIQDDGTTLAIDVAWGPVNDPDPCYYAVERNVSSPNTTKNFGGASPSKHDVFQATEITRADTTVVTYKVRALDEAVNKSEWSLPLRVLPFSAMPPPVPEDVVLEESDASIRVSWTPVEPPEDDLAGYQVERRGPALTVGGELLANGGFEQWTAGEPDGWSLDRPFGIAQETTNVYSGESSVAFNGYAQPSVSQAVQLSASTRFRLSLAAFRTNAVSWTIGVRNIDRGMFLQADGSWSPSFATVGGPSSVNSWEIAVVEFNTDDPAFQDSDAYKITVNIVRDIFGFVYLDDIRLLALQELSSLPWSPITDPPIGESHFVDHPLQNGNRYSYQVRAVDTAGNVSDPSIEVEGSPGDSVAPARPTGVVAIPGLGAGQISLRWDRVSDLDLAVYRVYRVPDWNTPIAPVGASMTEFTDHGFENTTYDYAVSAVDVAGNESELSAVVSATTRDSFLEPPELLDVRFLVDEGAQTCDPFFCCAPSDPIHLCSSAWTTEDDDVIQVHLQWQLHWDERADTFRVYRAPATSGAFIQIAEVDADVEGINAYIDESPPSYDFTYYVTAVDSDSGVRESAASIPARVIDDFEETVYVQHPDEPIEAWVHSVMVVDSRWAAYEYDNRRSYSTIVMWNRVPESQLMGYHVEFPRFRGHPKVRHDCL